MNILTHSVVSLMSILAWTLYTLLLNSCFENMEMSRSTLNSNEVYLEDYYPGEEGYGEYRVNGFVLTEKDSLSTFGVDVDNGSYTLARKKLQQNILPEPAGVRVEEFINYFSQTYEPPGENAIAAYLEGSRSPFNKESVLLRIGIKCKALETEERKPWNLTFLVDVSGSMTGRLSLVKQALFILVDGMGEKDKISLCTYAGGVRTLITPAQIDNKDAIKKAINNLQAGGSTAMASGMQNAYALNSTGKIVNGVNRVIVCSDGDANVGAVSHEEILKLIEGKVAEGITVTTLGFGQGNYQDQMMEQLANKGNGNYFYIDSEAEAKRLFTADLVATMQLAAKDVKIQVAFHSSSVTRYRLIGYENRDIADSNFVKEETDGGDMGVGHTVTALYELVLAETAGENLGKLHVRHKIPGTSKDIALSWPINKSLVKKPFQEASSRYRFTVGVAAFAEALKKSPHAEGMDFNALAGILQDAHDTQDDKDVELMGLMDGAFSLLRKE